jgi:hypothetical protein
VSFENVKKNFVVNISPEKIFTVGIWSLALSFCRIFSQRLVVSERVTAQNGNGVAADNAQIKTVGG